MPDLFISMRLNVSQIDQAFPIVQSMAPQLDIDQWRRFAAAHCDKPHDTAGIMTAQNGGYIHGLFSYSVEDHLEHRRILLIDNVFVVDLFNPHLVAEALLRAAETLAHDLKCSAVHTLLPRGSEDHEGYAEWLRQRFQEMGHHIETTALCKRLIQRPSLVWPAESANRSSGAA